MAQERFGVLSIINKFDLNKKMNPQKYNSNVLIGTTESHAIPIRPDELKVSIYKKNDKKLKVKEKEAEDIMEQSVNKGKL